MFKRIAVPAPRDFGWHLKDNSTSAFSVETSPTGQLVVILGHAPIRGVTCEMIHWWFQHFARMRVRLVNVPGYDRTEVPAYYLWHPIDHISAELRAPKNQGAWQIGQKIHIREAFQADVHGTRYLVDDSMELWYLKDGDYGGHGMGKRVPMMGWGGATRICWVNLPGDGGVHYHYEIAVGVASPGFLGRLVNKGIAGKFTSEFMDVWQRHNVIEVGVFENFLPALYAQRDQLPGVLCYDAATMNAAANYATDQEPADAALVTARMEAYMAAKDAVATVRETQPMGGPRVRW